MHSSRDGEEQQEPAAAAALRLTIDELGGGGGADPAASHGAAYANAVGVLAAHCREQLPRKLGQQVIRRLSAAARMARIREAGLDRLHVGLETGSLKVTKLCRKGVLPAKQLAAGKKAMAAVSVRPLAQRAPLAWTQL